MDTQPRHALGPADFEAILSHPSRAAALEPAIALCKSAWSILNEELRALGYDGDIPELEEGSKYEQYCELDSQLLEDADSVYHGSTSERQQDDNRNLEYFETTFEVHDNFSPRVKALALRTFARDLVTVAKTLSEKEIARAVSRIAINEDGTVDAVRTCRGYIPHFAIVNC